MDDFATFTVDELVRTAVAVNLSNNAAFTDEVTFNLYTSSAWAWGWSMPNTSGDEAYVTMAPDTLTYVYLWVDIPAIIDGMPLAETGPRFTLSAVSGLDKAVSTWSFDLLMNEKKNLSIDALEPSIQVAPNQDGRGRLSFGTWGIRPIRSTSPCRALLPKAHLLKVLRPPTASTTVAGSWPSLAD